MFSQYTDINELYKSGTNNTITVDEEYLFGKGLKQPNNNNTTSVYELWGRSADTPYITLNDKINALGSINEQKKLDTKVESESESESGKFKQDTKTEDLSIMIKQLQQEIKSLRETNDSQVADKLLKQSDKTNKNKINCWYVLVFVFVIMILLLAKLFI